MEQTIERSALKSMLWTGAVMAGHFIAVMVVASVLCSIVPRYQRIFQDFMVSLPVMTQFTLNVSHVLRSWWHLLVPPGLLVDGLMLFGLRCLPPGGRWLAGLWAHLFLLVVILLLAFTIVALAVPTVALFDHVAN